MCMNLSATSHAHRFRQRVARSIVMFWVAYFILATLRAWALNFDEQLDAAIRRLVLVSIGMALTVVIAQVLRLMDRRPIALIVSVGAVASLVATGCFALANWFLFYRLFPTADQIAATQTWGDRSVFLYATVETGFNLFYFFFGWVLGYAALLALAQVDEQHRRAMRASRAAYSAELRALRYQLNPHFLFNSLNLLSSLVAEDRKAEAERVILDLAELLRLMLAERPTEAIRLHEELEWQALYLSLEKQRYEERLEVDIDCPPGLSDVRVPVLITQPLIENAIKHGLSPSKGPVKVQINVSKRKDTLVIGIRNQGQAAPRSGHGIGLANVQERLDLIYGSLARLEAGPTDRGYEARLFLPIDGDKYLTTRGEGVWG